MRHVHRKLQDVARGYCGSCNSDLKNCAICTAKTIDASAERLIPA